MTRSRSTDDAERTTGRGGSAGSGGRSTSLQALRRKIEDLERELAATREERDELEVDERRWHSLAEQSPLGVVAYRPDGTVKYANPALTRLFDLTPEEHELLVAKYNILEDSSLRDAGAMEHIERAFAGEAILLPPVMYERESPIQKRSVRRWLEGLMYPVRDRKGVIREVVLIHTDITALRNAQEDLRESRDQLRERLDALEESEERFRDLAESIREVFWLFDLRGDRVVYASPAYETVWGRSVESLYRDYGEWTRAVHPDDRAFAEESFARIAEGQGGETREYRIVRPDGEVRWISDRGFVVRDDAGRTVRLAGIAEDITERKRQEEEHRRFETRVQHAQKLESLGVLAGGIAHDFNNLLMGILGNADVALVKLPPDSPAREPLARIKVASQRAAELTNQMLAYSGRASFQTEPTDFNRVVEEMSHLLRAVISKKARLQLEPGGGLPLVQADAAQVRQVVMNLITNASDALGNEDGVIRVTTSLVEVDGGYLAGCDVGEKRQPGPYLSLQVTDTGAGMNEATRERMFDPFFTTKLTGRGLGLAAVLGIVRGHEAALRVESTRGQGTSFTVLFPASETSTEVASPEPDPGPGSRGEATILVVEDEPAVREIAISFLEEAGYRTLGAADGLEGVEAVRAHRGGIDLVLLDLTMPGLSGEEALEEMRKIEPGVRVLLSSGYAAPDTGDRFPAENLAGFIQKPYGMDDLSRKVAEVLGETGTGGVRGRDS